MTQPLLWQQAVKRRLRRRRSSVSWLWPSEAGFAQSFFDLGQQSARSRTFAAASADELEHILDHFAARPRQFQLALRLGEDGLQLLPAGSCSAFQFVPAAANLCLSGFNLLVGLIGQLRKRSVLSTWLVSLWRVLVGAAVAVDARARSTASALANFKGEPHDLIGGLTILIDKQNISGLIGKLLFRRR